jgi:hypothetical protein
VVEWYKGSRASKIAIPWGYDGIFVHLKNKMFFAVLPNKIHQLAYHIFGQLA